MVRDIWLDDDEPGCLECGEVRFTASRIAGICADCASDAFSLTNPFSSFGGDSAVEDWDGVWVERY